VISVISSPSKFISMAKPPGIISFTSSFILSFIRLFLILVVLSMGAFSTSANAIELVNGGVVSGSISLAGESDEFTFTATAGEAAHIRVVDTSGSSSFYPRVWLYNPDGTLNRVDSSQTTVAFNCYSGASYCRLNQTGTYRLVVADYNDTNTGSYEIRLATVLQSNENGALVNDGVVIGDISVGDIDTFVFTATAGEAAHIRVVDTSGSSSFYPRVWLYNPDGTLNRVDSSQTTVAFDCYSGASYCRLNQTGTYRLVVADYNDTNTGSYEISFVGPLQPVAPSLDRDLDTVFDRNDNCPNVPNLYQQDSDNDGIGDVCNFQSTVITSISIKVTNIAGLYVREGPGIGHPIVTEITNSQLYVAFEQSDQDGDRWYRIYLPCGNTGWCAAWVAGNYQGTTYSIQDASATELKVIDTRDLGLNIRVRPGGSVSDSAYDRQRFVTLGSLPSGNGCSRSWYEIYTPVSSRTNTGWICGDYVQLASSVSAGSASLSGTVTGPPGLSVESISLGLTGVASMTTGPDGTGVYTFTPVEDGAYFIVPSISGYQFEPTSQPVTVYGAAVGGLDFRACQTGQSLTGVLRDQNNQLVTGAEATITVDGNIAGTLDANGNYSVTGLDCGDHTLTITPIGSAGFQTINLSIDTFNGWEFNYQWAVESTTFGLDVQSGLAGDPVNTATGNYIYEHRDLEIVGISFPFVFDRSYNSRDDLSGPLGFNWTHNWNNSLTVDAGGAVTVRWGDGGTDKWVPNGSGGFIPQSGVFDALIDDGGGAYTVRKRNLSTYQFDSTQRLNSVKDKNGSTVSLTYTGGNLTHIMDTAGRLISLTYDANNRMTQVIDPITRGIQFAYDLNGDLVTATDANGNVTTYTYDANHQILTVVDPRGNTIVSNTYDAQDRVVTYQTDAKGGATTYVYDSEESKTTFTDALDNETIHYHDSMLRLIKMVDGNGGIEVYEYDEAGNRTQVTDKNGNLTQYGYDVYGNVTSKTDALGNITTITYDSLNNPLTRTDALGNVTQFQYDASGNLVQTTDALDNTASVTYFTTGLPQTLTDALGNVTTHAYDAEGNRIQTTDALGNVGTRTYDGVGRRLSSTDPLGRIMAYSYDANDNLLTITDPLGNAVTDSYDGNNNRLSSLDRNGNLTSYSYDEKDLLASTTDALGNVVTSAYDGLDRRIAVTDARGNITQFGFDAVGNTTQATDALDNLTQYTYDPNGNRLSATDARGHTTTYQYDALNRRTKVTDPLGQSTTTVYDALGRIASVTSAIIGQVTANSYDALGRLIQVTNALDGIIQYGYDANGNRISTIDSRGNATAVGYDALDRRITVTDAIGNTTTTVYDAAGQVASITDKRGHTTTTSYDAGGHLIQITDALGNVTQDSYDANGNRLTTTDALSRVMTTAYDVLDRVISRTDAADAISTIGYDAAGNIVSETDRNGNTTQYTYDVVNRRIEVTDALGNITLLTYDAVGNRLSQTDPLDHVTATSFDANNRPTTTTDPLGNRTTNVYDPVGRVLSSTDAKGQTTSFAYDLLNRLITVTDAQSGVVNYTYDANGNRLSMTDPNENTTSYGYDVLNRKTATTEALGNISTLQYDTAGNVTQRTDARGLVTQYAYDALNRLVTTLYPEPRTVSFSYDAVGNRLQMTDSLGTTSTAYDDRNRITQVTDPFGITVQYDYDAKGNRTSLTYPSNKTVTYDYDARNQLTTVTDWLSQTTNYQYDAARRLALTTLPNSTTANYGYDSANRLTSLLNQKSDASVISSYAYTLDSVGNHLTEDRVEPLTPTLAATTQANAYDAENRLTDTNAIANSFDANGNLTAKGANDYAYDEESRLTQTTINAAQTQYAYDGRGNRYSRTRAGTTTRFVLDTNTSLTNVLAETDTLGNVQAYNVFGLGLIARILPDNTTHYYHYDSRGSTIALTNATETVTDSYAYDPFGQSVNAIGSNNNPFRFLGLHGVLDEGDYLTYIRARYYDTEQQRFISKDSYLGEDGRSQTRNRYAYALNSPIVAVDVDGKTPWGLLGGALSATVSYQIAATENLIDGVIEAKACGFGKKRRCDFENTTKNLEDYVGVFVGGFVEGYAVANNVHPAAAGAMSGAAGELTTQWVAKKRGNRETYDVPEIAEQTVKSSVISYLSSSVFSTELTDPFFEQLTGETSSKLAEKVAGNFFHYGFDELSRLAETVHNETNVYGVGVNTPVIPEAVEAYAPLTTFRRDK
jgi:RHS repeat-associated protein